MCTHFTLQHDSSTLPINKLGKSQNWIVSGLLSFQQQFISVVAAVSLPARVHKHQTRATQLWHSNWYHQWFTERHVLKSWLAAMSCRGSSRNIHFCLLFTMKLCFCRLIEGVDDRHIRLSDGMLDFW